MLTSPADWTSDQGADQGTCTPGMPGMPGMPKVGGMAPDQTSFVIYVCKSCNKSTTIRGQIAGQLTRKMLEH